MTDPDEVLRLLLAERSITQTLYDYAVHLDYGDEQRWLDCFTPEARWTLHAPDPIGREFMGLAELTDFFRWHSHAPEKYHKHLTCNITIDADVGAGRAQVQSYFVRIDRFDTPTLFAFGRYRDVLTMGIDRRWRFESRDIEYEAGLPRP